MVNNHRNNRITKITISNYLEDCREILRTPLAFACLRTESSRIGLFFEGRATQFLNPALSVVLGVWPPPCVSFPRQPSRGRLFLEAVPPTSPVLYRSAASSPPSPCFSSFFHDLPLPSARFVRLFFFRRRSPSFRFTLAESLYCVVRTKYLQGL